MAARALDLSYKQCLVDFFDGESDFNWHMRILLHSSPSGDGRWIAATPDHEVEVIDLSSHRVIPLPRKGEIPSDKRADAYVFDEFKTGELDEVLRSARELGEMIGFVKVGPAEALDAGRWFLSDPALDGFASLVPDAALAFEDNVIRKDGVGLVLIDAVWFTMERVNAAKVAAWKEKKANGAGVDGRLLPLRRDHRGRRSLSEEAAVAEWKSSAESDFPLSGPKLSKEFFLGLVSSGQSLTQHHMDFIRKSGVPERGGVAREHQSLTEVLRLLTVHDQVDVTMLAGGELACRRLYALETAVGRNPKNPDWEGLEHILSSSLTDHGAVNPPKFSAWLAGVQKEEAVVMKQTRLLREERAADAKRPHGKKE